MAKQKYDSGYKKSLKKKRDFLHFLKKYIGQPWTEQLTEEDLVLCDSEFILGDYSKRHADIAWEVKLKEQCIYLYIIQELQSSVDYTMPFRTLIYSVNMLLNVFLNTSEEEREKQGYRLPVVIAIVFYNGRWKWNALTQFSDYQLGYSFFEGKAIDCGYYLVDLTAVSEEYILNTNTLIDNLFAVDKMKNSMELIHILNEVSNRMKYLSNDDQDDFIIWLEKVLSKIFVKKEVVDNIIETMRGGEENMVHSMEWILKEELEEARSEGERRGEVRGERKGERKILLLLQHLHNSGQQDLIPEIMKDEELKNELYHKFRIL